MKHDLVQLMQKAIESAGEDFEQIGDVLLVSRLPKREVKTKSGLITATSTSNRQINAFGSNTPEFVKVLAVGKGYYDDETGEDVPVEVKPGYIIEVGRNSVNWFSSFGAILNNVDTGEGVGLTRDSERRMVFKSEDAYNKFMDVFFNPELLS